MVFFYSDDASKSIVTIMGYDFKHLFRVKRTKVGDDLFLRQYNDEHILYKYEVKNIYKKEAIIYLKDSTKTFYKPSKKLHLGWCVVDSKSIYKVLPTLNEIGVFKITFIYCDRSQKNFKIDFEKLRKIANLSNMQCGRSSIIEFDIKSSSKGFLDENRDCHILDFGAYENIDDISTILVGCEGGFTEDEKEMFRSFKRVSFKSNSILRSESAAVAVASKIIL